MDTPPQEDYATDYAGSLQPTQPYGIVVGVDRSHAVEGVRRHEALPSVMMERFPQAHRAAEPYWGPYMPPSYEDEEIREGFRTADARATPDTYWAHHAQTQRSATGLRSVRGRARAALDSDWDGRPPGFRAPHSATPYYVPDEAIVPETKWPLEPPQKRMLEAHNAMMARENYRSRPRAPPQIYVRDWTGAPRCAGCAKSARNIKFALVLALAAFAAASVGYALASRKK